MSNYAIEEPQVSAELLNRGFVRKLEQGHIKEAQEVASAFTRMKVRQESFAREIMPPVEIDETQLDRDELTDQPSKIVEKEPDSTATFIPFRGAGNRRWIKGERYRIYFGKTESEHFQKSKFELMTYQNDIRKMLSDNCVKDMADEEDKHWLSTVNAIWAANPAQDIDATAIGFKTAAFRVLFSSIVGYHSATAKRGLPIGCMLMTKATYYRALELDNRGLDILTRHYDQGVEKEDHLYGIKVVTTMKSDILPDDHVHAYSPQPFLGHYYLLADATLFIKQEADIFTFWAYAAPGVGFGGTEGVWRVRFA